MAQSPFAWRELRQQEAAIRRRRRRATERRRAGKRRIELPERDFLFFRSAPQAARSILFFGTGEKGNRLELSVNESKCEGADRVS